MTNEDWIFWSKDRPITWNDFQGIPEENKPQYAMTGNKIWYQWELQVRKDKPKFQFQRIYVKALFVKSQSWVKSTPTLYPEIVLKHEQGHFDIAEEYARKFSKILNDNLLEKSFSFKIKQTEDPQKKAHEEAQKIIKKLYEKFEIEYSGEHKKYDEETSHGTNLERQTDYNKRFDRLRTS